MDRRHQDQLMNRLEDAWLHGITHITWEELYLWYGVQKIAARTFRDLDERWRTLTESEQGPLMKIEGRAGIFLTGEKYVKKVDQNNLADQL